MNKELSLEEIRKGLEETWESVPLRNMNLWTGRGGAIMFHEEMLGRELTDEEKEQLKDGIYEISNIDGIKYLGKYE